MVMGIVEGRMAGTVGALGLSVVSSVSIIICNKALMSTLGFTFATTLTSWHLLVTFCSLHVALQMKLFENKDFDPKAVIGFGILNGISIGLLNLSLGFNSVGFYQMTKLAVIPCTVSLEKLFFRKTFSRSIQMALAILLFGVGIATVTDLQLNCLGSVLSLLAVLTTCISQIMTNTIQKKFKVSSTQLLYQSCPYQALTLFVIGPFLDGLLTNQNVFAFKYTRQILVFIILSCLISVSVNFSTFLVIGKTSPVTYQVLGHLKTCLVLGFGYVLLHDPFSWRNIVGILVALLGMILYSYFCLMESQQKALEMSAPLFHSQVIILLFLCYLVVKMINCRLAVMFTTPFISNQGTLTFFLGYLRSPCALPKSLLAHQLWQVKEGEADALLLVHNGLAKVTDIVVTKGPVWNSNRDLDA